MLGAGTMSQLKSPTLMFVMFDHYQCVFFVVENWNHGNERGYARKGWFSVISYHVCDQLFSHVLLNSK
jgi:hypothetical protein